MGLANLTVKMGCSHYKLTQEVERSAFSCLGAEQFGHGSLAVSGVSLRLTSPDPKMVWQRDTRPFLLAGMQSQNEYLLFTSKNLI